MGKRGPKPKGKVLLKWSADFAYMIGLIVTDGNLSGDGRHVAFVSKDEEQIQNFLKCTSPDIKVCDTISGYDGNRAYKVQFSDVLFYEFLQGIGIHPRKSKTIASISVPDEYFFDFLRGCFDGDGCFYSYWDPRWRSSHMFYVQFTSASKDHISWLKNEIFLKVGVSGHVVHDGRKITYSVKYAKKEALEIIRRMYYSSGVVCLGRKKSKIDEALLVEARQQKEYIDKNARVL